MSRLIAAIAGLCSLGASADPACANPTWVTADDFIQTGTNDAAANGVYIDGANVWVVGMSSDVLTGHWVVRKRSGTGPFSTVDDFIYSVGLRNAPGGLLSTGGTLFVYGGANDIHESGSWLVRASVNAGVTWATVDDFNPFGASHGYAMTLDASGAVLVGGYSDPGGNTYHWYTRRSTNLGASWTTTDDYSPIQYATAPRAMTTDKGHTVFASGYNWNGTQYRWQTRRQATTNGAWALVDDWTPITDTFAYYNASTYGAQPDAAASGQTPGVVLVTGTAYESDAQMHWITRRTLDNGASWIVVDDLADCGGRGIAFDKKDEKGFYAVGRCLIGGTYHWITRRSDVNGSNWVSEDDYLLKPGANSYPNDVYFGKSGAVYAVGSGNDGAHSHWIARVRDCSTETPTITPTALRVLRFRR